MKKLSAPVETIFVDLRKHKDTIDYENSSSEVDFQMGWAKLERIGDTIYRVYNGFYNKMPNAYILTFKPLQGAHNVCNNV